eukprot:TRINITY_DN34623_c0_g1_i1.p1 TRINITY_DN34623_c0_g1~~TRINITY_DN34623_c0_g1_i1.p1  ORF type:complete len:227 (+),score=59.94 TRINITY_DN34623_c0_g1_i1:84-764(+)
MSASVLSPRAYAALVAGGDGSGIMARLEAEVRRRAEEEWRRTGEDDELLNWHLAEKQLVRPRCGQSQESTAGSQDLEHPASQENLLWRQLEAQRQAFRGLQHELAETDKLLVERNQYCREVELRMGELSRKHQLQEEELASKNKALAILQEDGNAMERRCVDADAKVQELTAKNQKLERALQELCGDLHSVEELMSGCSQQQARLLFSSTVPGLQPKRRFAVRTDR